MLRHQASVLTHLPLSFSQTCPIKMDIWTGAIVCTAFYTSSIFLCIFTVSDAQVKVMYGRYQYVTRNHATQCLTNPRAMT
ncbi:hypothetical protein BJX63DRAFT_313724 [Aspergillus granulosus]|uniref:Uncharacterized protein n=1 Tax=Aspergillus granulosus TaxID=176169 RepID=A0ABR4HY60_9EURO